MNKVAILIPTWHGHIDYYKRFTESLRKHYADKTADIWCILSTDDNKDMFVNNGILVLPEKYNSTKMQGIINKKKLWGGVATE